MTLLGACLAISSLIMLASVLVMDMQRREIEALRTKAANAIARANRVEQNNSELYRGIRERDHKLSVYRQSMTERSHAQKPN